MRRTWIWILFWMSLFFNTRALATHIVGGIVTYKLIDPAASVYQIRLDIYQDCLTGDPTALREDNPAFIAIYRRTGTGNNTVVFDRDTVGQNGLSVVVPLNFRNECITNPPRTCLRQTTFIYNKQLPPSPFGYIIAYQRCCRNNSITNIYDPGATGATYFAEVPGGNVLNNSAVFTNYPPQIICVNNPLVYDHSAIDPDGDSLSYEFCEAIAGGSPSASKTIAPPPPYYSVNYVTPYYTATLPMAGNPVIRINPTTGLITGTPNIQGRFVVTVCCREWRNGVLINTVERDFQFVVTDCSKAVVANIPQYSEEFNTYIVQCKGFNVKFDNLSTGGITYYWDFGVPNSTTDTSTAFSPTFTYPDTGTYTVKLVVNRGTTCPDSISRLVKVYPFLRTNWGVTGLPCPYSPFQFSDSTISTYVPPNRWSWLFGDGSGSSEQNPRHAYSTGGNYEVTLVSGNAKGCLDTARKRVFVEDFRPFAGNDTIIVKGETIYFNARGGVQYAWTPGTNLSATNIPNPIGSYPETGVFQYGVYIRSANNCEGTDSIKVRVVDQPAVFVPSGFTPNGDGRNDQLRPVLIGYSQMKFFRVFNRWGELVFSTTTIGEGWDGDYKGQRGELGTYFWVMSVVDRFGKEEQYKGDVTLLR
jgi:gliding motility-associated-like protein